MGQAINVEGMGGEGQGAVRLSQARNEGKIP